MESPMLNEPIWVLDQDESATTYTRPLLGSELIYDHVLRHNNNLVEVAMGYTFKSSLDKKVLTSRVRDAMGRLRFTAPILGASIKSVEEGKYKRYWTYKPTNDPIAINNWIQDTLIIRHGPFDTGMEGIIAELNETPLPYKHRNGHLQYFGAYLFLGDDNTHCIFFHGTHSLLDAKPNLKAFELLRKWVLEPSLPPLDQLEWTTEWTRLPAGPVTATGGPRDEWMEKGVPLLQHIGASMANPIIPHALKAQRDAIAVFGRASRARIVFDKDTSLRIIRKLKQLGLGVTYWGEAAHVLATFIANPPSAEEEETAHFNLEHTMISQDRYLVPPHNTPSHLISGLSLVPIIVQYKDIPKNASRKDQLIAIMRIMKAQYDDYLTNPHLPHMLHAMLELFPPPPKPWEWPNMNAPMMTNFGIVEQFLTLTPDSGKDGKEVGPMDIIDMRFGHRIAYTRIVVHVWTIHSEINFQIQAADNWDKEYIQEQANLFAEVAKTLLEDEVPRRVEPLSNSSH